MISLKKSNDNLDSILEGRDITLLTKVHTVKAMVFPLVMYRCESWTIRKTKCQRTDAFELWCWRRLLRVPWTERRSNQSILKEINPEYLLDGHKLKLQYFWPTDTKSWLIGKDPNAGKYQRQKKKEVTKMRSLDGNINWMDMSLSELPEIVKDKEAWYATVQRVRKSQAWFSKWTTKRLEQTFF